MHILDPHKQLNIYLVGGAVRDQLLGITPVERDFVVVGANEQLMVNLGFQKVGKDFPVFIHPGTGEEYALARTERKNGKGYYGFSCNFGAEVTLEQDLARRDLTINAIAKDPAGKLIDPFGGQRDLAARILRHVSPAFGEDPVRVLRVARFAAKFTQYGFKVAPETLALMQELVAQNELDHLTPERVWKEMEKALAMPDPQEFFLILKQVGALAIIFPELHRLWGIPQTAVWHPEIDTGEHVMLALKQAVKFSTDLQIRFAVLCHDLGKGTTDPRIWPKHHGHEARGVPLIINWCKKYKVPNAYQELAIKVAKWHLHSHRSLELTANTILKVFLGLDAFRKPELFAKFLIACKADATGRQGQQALAYPQAEFLQALFQPLTALSVVELMEQGLTGKKLGEGLHKLRIRLIKQGKIAWQQKFS